MLHGATGPVSNKEIFRLIDERKISKSNHYHHTGSYRSTGQRSQTRDGRLRRPLRDVQADSVDGRARREGLHGRQGARGAIERTNCLG